VRRGGGGGGGVGGGGGGGGGIAAVGQLGYKLEAQPAHTDVNYNTK